MGDSILNKITFETRPQSEWPEEIIDIVKTKLTLQKGDGAGNAGENSCMRQVLNDLKYNPELTIVWYRKRPIAAGITFTYYWQSRDDQKEIHTYVKKHYRRMGIGTKLFNHILAKNAENSTSLFVRGWNRRAMSFYRNCKNISDLSLQKLISIEL